MALFITRIPEKILDGSIFSRWTALHNPYLFEFTRQDYPVVSTLMRLSYHLTLPTVKVTGDLTSLASVGDTIYLNSGIYNGAYTIVAITYGASSYVTIDTTFIGSGGSGYMNLSEILINYKAYINIYDAATGSVIDTLYMKPDSTGLIMADVSGVIKSVLVTEDTCGFTLINQKNDSISGAFYLGYGVSYTFASTFIQTLETDDGTVYHWLSAAMQITGKTVLGIAGAGQNMKVYVPYNMSGSAAKFLTMFEKPTKFAGYPFTIGFIYSELFPDNYLERHQINYNINLLPTSSETNQTLLVSEVGYVNDLQIADEDATTTQMDVWLETGGTMEDGYVVVGGLELGSASEFAAPLGV